MSSVLLLVVVLALLAGQFYWLRGADPARERGAGTAIGRFLHTHPLVAPTAAVVVGFLLRVVWVVAVAAEPSETNSDTGRMLAMARQFADGETYRLNGLVTAFHPPGLPFVLTPIAWVSRVTGWFSLPLGAGLLNAAAGTASIGFGAVLATRWFGRAAGVVAAWLLALAPGHIFLTAVPLTETLFTATVLGTLVAITGLARSPDAPSTRALIGVGALIAFATLVRGPGLVLILVAWLQLRPAGTGWRDTARTGVLLVAGTCILFVPWTIRNGVQVGVWTPGATNNAAFLCHGHGDHAVADVDDLTPEKFAICFRGTPYDRENPEEAAWYGRTAREAIGWALTHPIEEISLTVDKTAALFAGDRQSVSDASDFG
ncbi:MAG: hypothetical protein AAGK32_15045, partial [Actinomycetota bacterium]